MAEAPCAAENDFCTCHGRVRLGVDDNWTAWREVSGSVECTAAALGAAPPSPQAPLRSCVCAAEDALHKQVLVLVLIAGIILAIWRILQSRGWRAQVLACTFVSSLVVTQLGMKQLSAPPFRFRFPACVTVLHFCTMWLVCGCYWLFKGKPNNCLPSSMGSTRRYFTAIIPIACSLPLSVVFNNQAMIFVGASVNAVIGTLAPIVTAVLSRLLGKRFARASWLGVAVACAGALLITAGEVQQASGAAAAEAALTSYGFLLSFTSVLCRSIKVVLQDMLLKPRSYSPLPTTEKEVEDKGSAALEPMHVWVLQAPPCALVAMTCVLCSSESPAAAWGQLTPGTVGVILCTCVSAVALNLSGMMTVKELGASSAQIVGKLNIIITVALAVAFLGESLPAEVLAGSVVVLMGVGIFERGEAMLHAQTAASAAKA